MMTKKQTREFILAKCDGNCAYCGISLIGIKWHIDHLEPVNRISTWEDGKFIPTGVMRKPENDVIENMLPSCPSCNIAKSSMSLQHFRETIEDKLTQLERESNYRIAKRYGLLKETHKKVLFYFEKEYKGKDCDSVSRWLPL